MMPRTVNVAAVRRTAVRVAKDSARLERRVVPEGFVRSERVERYLAARRARS